MIGTERAEGTGTETREKAVYTEQRSKRSTNGAGDD